MGNALIVEIFGNAKEFAAELDKAAGKTRQFGKVAGVAGLAIAGGLAFGLEKSTEAAGKFQQSMELLHTQAGASTVEVDKMSKALVGMATSVGTSPEELSQGLYHIESAGLRGAKALEALKIAAEGAKIGGANLEDVTNGLNAVIVSGIKGSKDFSSAMGDLNATVGAGDMRMQDLSDALGTGLPAKAALFGISLKDVSAALAVFGDNNIRGAEAGTQLASAIRLMAAPSGAAADHLKSIGLSSTQLATDMRGPGGLVSAITDLKKHMEDAGLSATEQGALLSRAFGGRQAGGIMLLIDQVDRFKTKLDEVSQGANGFGAAWDATTKTAAFSSDRYKASLQALQIAIGTGLLPILALAADKFAVVGQYLAQHATLAKLLVAALAGLAAVLLTVSVATKVVAAAQAIMTAGQWLLNAALDANPIGIVVLALAALAGAIYVAWTHSQTFRNIVLGVWEVVKKIVVGYIDIIKAEIGGLIAAFQAVIGVLEGIYSAAKSAFGAIGDVVNAKLPDGVHATKYGGVGPVGHRAGGGPVSAGMSYIVGERGPELLTMGGGGGHITPNGGGGVTNVFNFPNYVGSRQELVAALLQFSKDNGGTLRTVLGGA